jgi:hypothetical protein
MRKLTATFIVGLIGLIALSVSSTAVACGDTADTTNSSPK